MPCTMWPFRGMAPLTFKRLRLLNVIAAVVQLTQGIVIFAITPYNPKGKLPWYTMFLQSWSRDGGPASAFYRPDPVQVVNFPIGVYSGVFLVLSGIDHLLVVLPGINQFYNRLLCQNRNPFRWAEYAVSASLMSVMQAQLCGITDIHLLVTIFALVSTTMCFGWLMEVLNGDRIPTFEYAEDPAETPKLKGQSSGPQVAVIASNAHEIAPMPAAPSKRVDWTPFIMGCWPCLVSTLVTACYFFQAVVSSNRKVAEGYGGEGVPDFVWSLIFILTFLYAMFAVNQFFQFKQVRGWRGFGRAEYWYIVLSFSSKSLLAWINFGGSMRFQSEGN